MKKFILSLVLTSSVLVLFSQSLLPPDKIYGELFADVQLARIFPDRKTFVDCVPKRDPAAIVADYKKIKNNPAIRFSLELFVKENFEIPSSETADYKTDTTENIEAHIRNLWKVLRRDADKTIKGSSLLPLPYPYIVPGGRFREIYYWDSYFTMLGLKESGEHEMIGDMVKNFAYLINTYGHIPNGNRTYYLTRSQPPFFALMVSLLAEIKGDSIYLAYLPALEKEYRYFMSGTEKVKPGQALRRVVKLKDGTVLNRYWDDTPAPRQESYAEDVETAEKSGRNKAEMYRHLRAGAESGIDFSSRWFSDEKNITTIRTTDILPVDLNCLLYNLESTIAKAKWLTRDETGYYAYRKKATIRKNAILKYFWNSKLNFFTDYNFRSNTLETVINPAGLYPLFTLVATPSQAAKIAEITRARLLKAGGIITTNNRTGEQWDSPNGWAPLQWISIRGLENYKHSSLARTIAERWIDLNERVFKSTGKMLEKYNVIDLNIKGGGGEYPTQDGFGWTNGVYLKLVSMYANERVAN